MQDTLGQRLKKAREYRNLTFDKVEEATRIRAQYLQALEADDFSALPSPIQARGFLRNYAQYLGLDLDQVIEEIRAASSEQGAEPEVIFEDAQTPVKIEEEPTQPIIEDDASAENVEPFWQTWLRRVKQETGGLQENEDAAQPSLGPVSSKQGAPVSEPESHPETEAAQNVQEKASGEKIETEVLQIPRESLSNWVRARIPHKEKEITPAAKRVEEELQPELEPVPVSQPDAAAQGPMSQEIINRIALQLRQRREMLSLTLEEIERHTRMRAQFMEALEKGNFDELPSPVQTRGMLSNYASFLDLDVDDLMLQFAEALQARHRERHPESPARRRGQPNVPDKVPALRSFIAGDLVFGVGIVLLLVVFSVWGISRVIALQSEQQAEVQAEATGPSISEALIGTPVGTVESQITLIPAEDTPIPALSEGTVEIPTLVFDANVQINIIAVERTFLRVVVDGEEVFNSRTIPGNAYPFEAEESIEILAGSGAALRVVYNQRDLGLLGGFGQIASFIYTPDEIIVPTPEIPPTLTSTPYLSPTPTITSTPTATSTPTPTVAAEDEIQ